MAILESHGGTVVAPEDLEPVIDAATVVAWARELLHVHVAPELQGYIVDLVEATRHHRDLLLGVSPRGALALQRASRALAASLGRSYVTPDDVKSVAPVVLEHRLVLSPEAQMRGVAPTAVLSALLDSVAVPGTREL
jgi:MoxR-like ATPase